MPEDAERVTAWMHILKKNIYAEHFSPLNVVHPDVKNSLTFLFAKLEWNKKLDRDSFLKSYLVLKSRMGINKKSNRESHINKK